MDTGPGSNGTNPGTVAAFGGGLDGHLLSELQSAGVKLDNIETVFTRLYPDHVGWILTQSGKVDTFPKAKYVAHQAV